MVLDLGGDYELTEAEKASEFLWGSMAEALKAVAASEGRELTKHWEIGDYMPGVQGEGFTAAHWFLPEELQNLFESKGAKTVTLAGLESLSSHHRKETNKLHRNSERWRMWTEILLKTCTHPSVVGVSEHFMLVCKKHG